MQTEIKGFGGEKKNPASPWVMSDLSAPWKITDLSSSASTAGLLLSVLWRNGNEKKVGDGGGGVLKCDLSDFWTNWALLKTLDFVQKHVFQWRAHYSATTRMTIIHYVLWLECFSRLSLELNYPFYSHSKGTCILPSFFFFFDYLNWHMVHIFLYTQDRSSYKRRLKALCKRKYFAVSLGNSVLGLFFLGYCFVTGPRVGGISEGGYVNVIHLGMFPL